MKRGIVFLGALILLAIVGSLNVSANGKQTAGAPSSIFGPASIVQAQSSGNQLRPVVSQAAHSDVSPPLRSIRPIQPQYDPKRPELRPARINHPKPQGVVNDSTQLTSRFSPLAMPTPIQNFEGIYNLWGGYPPDTNGEVGANNYVQIVNLGFQIWTKTGTSLYGPANFNTLFTGFGGPCEIRNDGDPVVVYDQMANRWLLTQFTTAAPYFQCNALSTSGDPTGSYYRYAFSEAGFEDYPHYGVWPDAYYMSANGNGGAGGHYAYERDRMLVGDPAARQIVFHTADAGLLPSDMDGPTPPPPGSPNYYLEWYTANPGQLREWKYHVDWTTPANSTFSGPTTIPVNNFDVNLSGIPQPGTSVVVDDLSDRLMYRVPYRNFGDHEVLLANHTVRSSTTNVAGIRWYEVRDPAGTPAAFQQGTYSPDTTYRWMASVAMDRMGDIGVGFSASSSTVYPSIRYAGRLVGDPLGELSQGEATIIDGTASQIGTASRWGDYSDITVDP